MKHFSIALLLSLVLQGCDLIRIGPKSVPSFETTPHKGDLPQRKVDEASGLVASRSFPNHVWIHEDGFNPAALHLVSHTAEYKGKVDLPIENRDWEDIAIGPGPEAGANYIYIGDIGDNKAIFDEYMVYRLKEPKSLSEVPTVETLRFKYPDGKYDAEALLLDPTTKDLYVVTKRNLLARIYLLRYPQSTTELATAEFMGTMTKFAITGGDISPDGTEILIRNYESVFYWKRRGNDSVSQTLRRAHDAKLPYWQEIQGEGICFDAQGKGYYTVGERNGVDTNIPLYYFARK